MLEGVLCGPEGEKWKQDLDHLPLPPEYDDWLDAQALSAHRLYVANWKDTIHPLERTRSREVLDEMWDTINLVRHLSYNPMNFPNVQFLYRITEHSPTKISTPCGT